MTLGIGMYALGNRPSLIVSNARIGPSKSFNNLENRDPEKQQAALGMSSPKPVFNGNKVRYNNNNVRQNNHGGGGGGQQNAYTAQHEEMVKYLSETWNKVNYEYERNQREGGPVWYREKNPNPRLNDFRPFDLEEFWGRRYLQQAMAPSSS